MDEQVQDDDLMGTEDNPLIVKPEAPFETPRLIAEWSSFARPYAKKKPVWYLSFAVIVIASSVVLIALQQWTFLLAVLAGSFLIISTNVVEPKEQRYTVTNLGIRIGSKRYGHEELHSFWFETDDETPILHVKTYRSYPAHIDLPLPKNEDEAGELIAVLNERLIRYLPYNEEGRHKDLVSWLDTLVDKLTPYLPKPLISWYLKQFGKAV